VCHGVPVGVSAQVCGCVNSPNLKHHINKNSSKLWSFVMTEFASFLAGLKQSLYVTL
jgi:hypothetical protein